MLCKSSRFVLEPWNASEEVEASSSPPSTTIALSDTVALATVEEIGEGVALVRWTSAVACSTWSSWPTGEAGSGCLEAGNGALTQRRGGSTLHGGGVFAVRFMNGSGLRSDGGMRSGLEDPDLLRFLVNSSDFVLPNAVTEPTAVV